MGIYNRDYMKRPSDDDEERAYGSDEKLEAFFSGFLRRHPRFFLYFGIGLTVVVVAAIVLAKTSSK